MTIKTFTGIDKFPYQSTLLDLADQSDHSIRVSAILVQGGKMISRACNSRKTHTVIEKYRKYRKDKNGNALKYVGSHAEFRCIHGIDRETLKKSVLYVVRIRRDKSIAPSLPCMMCHRILSFYGLREVRCVVI